MDKVPAICSDVYGPAKSMDTRRAIIANRRSNKQRTAREDNTVLPDDEDNLMTIDINDASNSGGNLDDQSEHPGMFQRAFRRLSEMISRNSASRDETWYSQLPTEDQDRVLYESDASEVVMFERNLLVKAEKSLRSEPVAAAKQRQRHVSEPQSETENQLRTDKETYNNHRHNSVSPTSNLKDEEQEKSDSPEVMTVDRKSIKESESSKKTTDIGVALKELSHSFQCEPQTKQEDQPWTDAETYNQHVARTSSAGPVTYL